MNIPIRNISRQARVFTFQIILEYLNRPQDKLKFIHVAGTNGKGSVAATLNSILQEAGYKVGLYTSPHIQTVNERIQINSAPIPFTHMIQLENEIHEQYIKLGIKRPGKGYVQTGIALKYFAEEQVDIVIFESHIGGLYDPTNVIENTDLAIFTDIAIDHTDMLGETIEDISESKSFIIKNNSNVVLYTSKYPVANKIIKEKSIGHNFKETNFSKIKIKQNDFNGLVIDYKNYKDLKTPLLGDYQSNNLATVIEAIESLKEKGYNISNQAIYDGILKVNWPGRFEIYENYIFDVAHNPQGIKVLLDSLDFYFPNKKNIFVFNNYVDHDYTAMLDMIKNKAEKIYFTTVGYSRELNLNDLSLIYKGNYETNPDIRFIINELQNYDKNKYNIIFTGSFPIVGEAMNILKRE